MSVDKQPIAIVDDDESILDAMSNLLESFGYVTVVFSSGEAFLSYERKGDVRVLVTDVNMPGMNGFELQRQVRLSHPDMAVIMMTALSDATAKQRALAGGAKELLRKPIMVDDLIRCIENLDG